MMKINWLAVCAVVLPTGFLAPLDAAQPDLQTGLWRYESTTQAEGGFPFRNAQSTTTTDCLTSERIDEGRMFHEMDQSCVFTQREIRTDGMRFAARCGQDGQQIHFEGESTFGGDEMEGVMTMTMQTPVGSVVATTHIRGERIGECDAGR